MAGPGDERAAGAGGRSHLRASHTDREQVIQTLKAAFVQGRLDLDEFGLRVGQTFASRTYAELAAITADLPAGLNTAKPPTPARSRDEQPVLRPGKVIAAATAAYALLWVFVVFLSTHSGEAPWAPPLIFGGCVVYLLVLSMSVAQMVALRRQKSSGGQSPRRTATGAGGQAPRSRPSVGPGRQLPPPGHGHQHVAEAAPRRLTGPALPGSWSLRLAGAG